MLHFQVSITSPHAAHFTFEPPVHLLTRLIPQASIAYCEKPWGTILLQEIAINGFTVGSYTFDLKTNCEISFDFTRKLVALQYATRGLGKVDNSIRHFPFIDLQHGLYYLPPGQSIKLKFPIGRYNFWQIHFTLSLIKKIALKQPVFTHFQQPGETFDAFNSAMLPIDKRTKNGLAQLEQHLMETPFDVYFINGQCMHLLMSFITGLTQFNQHQKWLSKKEQQFLSLEELISNHFSEKESTVLTIEFLAKKMSLSIYQLKKLCAQRYNLSPFALINKIRMEKAMTLLLQSGSSVSRVCFKLGYQDISSFSRAFKSFYGKPPSDFLTANTSS